MLKKHFAGENEKQVVFRRKFIYTIGCYATKNIVWRPEWNFREKTGS